MSWVHLEDKVVRARKPHRCYLCGEPIEKGEKYLRRSGVEEGEGFASVKMHPACEEHTKDWDEHDWECHDVCGFQQLLSEECPSTSA